jgi:hypothetical protein
MYRIKLALYAAAIISSLASTASAGSVTLYDNLGAATNSQDKVLSSDQGTLADSFSTGKDAVMLVDVQLKLFRIGAGNGSIEVYLYSDNGGPGVGGQVWTVTTEGGDSISDTKPAVYDYKLSEPFSLKANTRYWIKVEDLSSGASNVYWCWSSDTTGTGVAKEYYSDKSGVSANDDTDFGPFQMRVLGQTAPEPSSVVLLGIGVVVCAVLGTQLRKGRD